MVSARLALCGDLGPLIARRVRGLSARIGGHQRTT
jgi:hypothetical protein